MLSQYIKALDLPDVLFDAAGFAPRRHRDERLPLVGFWTGRSIDRLIGLSVLGPDGRVFLLDECRITVGGIGERFLGHLVV